ncbi:uncharacterized protein LAJ45_03712 [Morchella importuna]|uniref:uncharacterized protein n=1 Tax=Morchella importuna TaxID=1174673 RepID=UPI001E8CF6E6|nr:uncharacterized protein LAJ45_03712 [Morchella importuna]KAH8152285.1 hypothetical protein LAJ45_03712 [Morchella importuna]
MTTNTTLPDDVASTRDTRKAKVADHTHGIDHSIDQIASVITGATLHLETINKNLAGLGYDPISDKQIRLYKDFKFQQMRLYHELKGEILKEEMELVREEKAQDEAAGITQ